MTSGPVSHEEPAQDLVLAMRHIEPLLKVVMELLQNSGHTDEPQIEALSALMERFAAAFEGTTK